MDPRTRKLAGYVIAAVGVIAIVVGALADTLGLGGEGGDDFGPKQIIALVIGLVLLAGGLAMSFLPLGQKESAS